MLKIFNPFVSFKPILEAMQRKKPNNKIIETALKLMDKTDVFIHTIDDSKLGKLYEATRLSILNTGGMHMGIPPKDMIDFRELLKNGVPHLIQKYKKKRNNL